jgi:hypothetical protein
MQAVIWRPSLKTAKSSDLHAYNAAEDLSKANSSTHSNNYYAIMASAHAPNQ